MTTPTFRPAKPCDLDAILDLYNQVFTAEEAGQTTSGWRRGLYPDQEIFTAALDRGDLILEEAAGTLVGAAIINHQQNDYYARAPWQIDAPPEKILVLHTFAIAPTARGHGYGRAMLDYFAHTARTQGCLALRLDTSHRNHFALHLYEHFGFQRVAELPVHFDGMPEFHMVLFEKALD